MKAEQIRDSLVEQLTIQNKLTEYSRDLVDTYVDYWKMKEDMVKDVAENGLRIKSTSGNGFKVTKPNESVSNLPKITTAMLKILSELGLKEHMATTTAGDDYL